MKVLKRMISVNPVITNSDSPPHRCIQKNILAYSDDGSILSKIIFYAGSVCNGSLVHEAGCIVCKRTSVGKCVKCNQTCKMSNHESCKILMSFGKKIVQNS